jgi:hypothetical protein
LTYLTLPLILFVIIMLAHKTWMDSNESATVEQPQTPQPGHRPVRDGIVRVVLPVATLKVRMKAWQTSQVSCHPCAWPC